MGGPDGWRWAIVRWAKGDHPSRKLHYFEGSSSLCGAHSDGITGWYTKAKTVFKSSYEEGFRCNKCLIILEGRQSK